MNHLLSKSLGTKEATALKKELKQIGGLAPNRALPIITQALRKLEENLTQQILKDDVEDGWQDRITKLRTQRSLVIDINTLIQELTDV